MTASYSIHAANILTSWTQTHANILIAADINGIELVQIVYGNTLRAGLFRLGIVVVQQAPEDGAGKKD